MLAKCDTDEIEVDDEPEKVIGESIKKSIRIGILSICLSLSMVVESIVPPEVTIIKMGENNILEEKLEEYNILHQKHDFFAFNRDNKSGIVVLIGTCTEVFGSFESWL